MPAAADRRPEFTPPPEPGLVRSVSLAVAAHALLVLALSWGITWKRNDDAAVVEAELWSPTPQQAAPRPVEPPPAPPPPPPPPAPAPAVQPPPPPVQRDAEIALEKERERKAAEEKRREDERRRQQELEKREQARKAAEEKQREEQARKAAEEQKRQEQARKAAEEKKREEQAKAARERKQKEEAAALEKMRKENLERIAGLAGATGSPSSQGTAQRSSGPSSSYAGRIAAVFKRNVVYPGGVDTIVGNPEAEIQVKVSPTGEILSARLVRSSGNPSWDEAALRAIERSDRIPPDVDGRYVQDFRVGMRPKS